MAKGYTKAQLEGMLNNPNVRKMLDLISYSEGTTKNGYYTTFGGGRQTSLARHENRQRTFKQTDGKTNSSGAAGRYGFLKSTWDEYARRYNLTNFGERNQDIAALAIIADRGQLQKVLNGDLHGAVSKLGGAWASFPSSNYAQPKHSWATIDNFIKTGKWNGKATTSSSAPGDSGQQQAYQPETPQGPQLYDVQLPEQQQYQPQTVNQTGNGVFTPLNPQSMLANLLPQSIQQPVAQPNSLFGSTNDLFSSQPVTLATGVNDLLGGIGYGG